MKFGKFLTFAADQIASTALLVFLAYAVVNGVIRLWQHPPSLGVVLAILIGGLVLGLGRYFEDEKNEKDTGEKNKLED